MTPQPDGFGGAWETDSRRIDVVYRRFEPEIPLRAFVDDLVPLLPTPQFTDYEAEDRCPGIPLRDSS